jgi:hypothetical protein
MLLDARLGVFVYFRKQLHSFQQSFDKSEDWCVRNANLGIFACVVIISRHTTRLTTREHAMTTHVYLCMTIVAHMVAN